eukprot:2547242-Rhodomonas_salina.1
MLLRLLPRPLVFPSTFAPFLQLLSVPVVNRLAAWVRALPTSHLRLLGAAGLEQAAVAEFERAGETSVPAGPDSASTLPGFEHAA